MGQVEALKDFGQVLSEESLKKGLQELCPMIHFDPAGRLDGYHPFIDSRQGVYYNMQHIASMDRGMIPEYNVWGVVTRSNGKKEKSHVVRVGWRHTLHRIATMVPDMNWEKLCAKFNIEHKHYEPPDQDHPELEL